MHLDDHEQRIEELSGRYERAELAVALVIAELSSSPSPSELAAARRQIEALLAALLSETVTWIDKVAPEAYQQGVTEAVSAMGEAPLVDPEAVYQRQSHQEALRTLTDDLVEDMARVTEYMERDAKRILRKIGRRQLLRSISERDPVRRAGDFRAELEERGVRFADRSGRRWRPGAYAKMALLTQTGVILNTAAGYTAADLGSPGVAISDGGPGDVDEPCRRAGGQTWSVAYFLTHLLEHPNCRRSGAPKPRSWSGDLDRTTEAEAA